MKEIKAIETVYKNCKFRSRLEARYAVFMDVLGINWVYELEGYELQSGRYLPDFYLPSFEGGSFAEVKFKFNEKEIQLCRELCMMTNKSVILFEGMPDSKVYNYFWMDGELIVRENCGIPNADQAEKEDRMYAEPGYESMDGFIRGHVLDCLGDNYLEAVTRAKMARFEFIR